MSGGPGHRLPLSPREGWLSEGRQVLHFQPVRWDRWNQPVEVTVGELLPDQPVPLLKRRTELSREEALKLWAEKRRQAWQSLSLLRLYPLLCLGTMENALISPIECAEDSRTLYAA